MSIEREAVFNEAVPNDRKFKTMELSWGFSLIDYFRILQTELDEIEDLQIRRDLAESYQDDLKGNRRWLVASELRCGLEANTCYGANELPGEQGHEIVLVEGYVSQEAKLAALSYRQVGDYYTGYCLSLLDIHLTRDDGASIKLGKLIVPVIEVSNISFTDPQTSAN